LSLACVVPSIYTRIRMHHRCRARSQPGDNCVRGILMDRQSLSRFAAQTRKSRSSAMSDLRSTVSDSRSAICAMTNCHSPKIEDAILCSVARVEEKWGYDTGRHQGPPREESDIGVSWPHRSVRRLGDHGTVTFPATVHFSKRLKARVSPSRFGDDDHDDVATGRGGLHQRDADGDAQIARCHHAGRPGFHGERVTLERPHRDVPPESVGGLGRDIVSAAIQVQKRYTPQAGGQSVACVAKNTVLPAGSFTMISRAP
jgi:hypothetical protein